MTELAPLLKALNDTMKAVGYVQKDKKNAFHGYKYAGEEAVLEALRPELVKNGILLIPSLDGEVRIDEHGNTHLVAAYTLAHVSGAVWPEKLRIPGAGNDKNKNGIGDKGTYKALTGANKYLLFKLFQIATGDDPEVANANDRGDEPERTISPGTLAPTNGPNPTTKRQPGDMTIDDLRSASKEALDDIEAAEGDEQTLRFVLSAKRAVLQELIRRKPDWWAFADDETKGFKGRTLAVIRETETQKGVKLTDLIEHIEKLERVNNTAAAA